MRALLLVFILVSLSTANSPFRLVVENWLTPDYVADFNRDGIVNLKDFAMIYSYGSGEYGSGSYGN